jgi:hypothetical protein
VPWCPLGLTCSWGSRSSQRHSRSRWSLPRLVAPKTRQWRQTRGPRPSRTTPARLQLRQRPTDRPPRHPRRPLTRHLLPIPAKPPTHPEQRTRGRLRAPRQRATPEQQFPTDRLTADRAETHPPRHPTAQEAGVSPATRRARYLNRDRLHRPIPHPRCRVIRCRPSMLRPVLSRDNRTRLRRPIHRTFRQMSPGDCHPMGSQQAAQIP